MLVSTYMVIYFQTVIDHRFVVEKRITVHEILNLTQIHRFVLVLASPARFFLAVLVRVVRNARF